MLLTSFSPLEARHITAHDPFLGVPRRLRQGYAISAFLWRDACPLGMKQVLRRRIVPLNEINK